MHRSKTHAPQQDSYAAAKLMHCSKTCYTSEVLQLFPGAAFARAGSLLCPHAFALAFLPLRIFSHAPHPALSAHVKGTCPSRTCRN